MDHRAALELEGNAELLAEMWATSATALVKEAEREHLSGLAADVDVSDLSADFRDLVNDADRNCDVIYYSDAYRKVAENPDEAEEALDEFGAEAVFRDGLGMGMCFLASIVAEREEREADDRRAGEFEDALDAIPGPEAHLGTLEAVVGRAFGEEERGLLVGAAVDALYLETGNLARFDAARLSTLADRLSVHGLSLDQREELDRAAEAGPQIQGAAKPQAATAAAARAV